MAYSKRDFLDIVQMVRNSNAARMVDPTLSDKERADARLIFRNCSKDLETRIPETIANPDKPIGPG